MIIITEPRKQKSEWNDISDNTDREYMELSFICSLLKHVETFK
jgi:hypothetical protein